MSNCKRTYPEAGDLADDQENSVAISVDLIKRKSTYKSEEIHYPSIYIPECKVLLNFEDKYRIFASTLNVNTQIALKDAESDLRTFLSNLLFVIYKHEELGLELLMSITKALNIGVLCEDDIITTEKLLQLLDESKGPTSTEDKFVEMHRLISDIIKRVSRPIEEKLSPIKFLGDVNFTQLHGPFNLSTFKTRAVRVSFEDLIAPFVVEKVTSSGNKVKPFFTRKIKNQKFITELSKFIEHGEMCMSGLVWESIDIGSSRDDEVKDVIINADISPVDVIRSENYALINDIIIYKNPTKSETEQSKFNLRTYSKRVITFNYDSKLDEEYRKFLSLNPLKN